MIQLAFCDDDEIFLKSAKEILDIFLKAHNLEAKMYFFKSVNELDHYLEDKENKLELLFLDIELNEENGISVAKRINEQRANCKIAFVTNYLSYISDVYEVGHFYYVVKSELKTRLPKIFKMFMEDEKWKLVVPIKGQTLFFQFRDICYVESGRRQSKISTYQTKETVSMPFKEVCEYLSGNVCFTRCHNSYMVNFNAVDRWLREKFSLKTGEKINISRKYRKQVELDYLRWREEWL